MALWERKRILIWGKTRPELSTAYKETVCTGGVFEDSRDLVRLYPIPLRFLDDERSFKKYQWVTAEVKKATKDPRPESYIIRPSSIDLGEVIPTSKGNWTERSKWIIRADRIFDSVESLQHAREIVGTSLGMVKPHEVASVVAEPYSETEKRAHWNKRRRIMAQRELPFDPDNDDQTIRLVPPPDFRFRIEFRCEQTPPERYHQFTVFDWEVDALYNRLRRGGDTSEEACNKVVAKLKHDVCGPDKDTFFFLGNIKSHPQIFTIVGLWYPKKQHRDEASLFDTLT